MSEENVRIGDTWIYDERAHDQLIGERRTVVGFRGELCDYSNGGSNPTVDMPRYMRLVSRAAIPAPDRSKCRPWCGHVREDAFRIAVETKTGGQGHSINGDGLWRLWCAALCCDERRPPIGEATKLTGGAGIALTGDVTTSTPRLEFRCACDYSLMGLGTQAEVDAARERHYRDAHGLPVEYVPCQEGCGRWKRDYLNTCWGCWYKNDSEQAIRAGKTDRSPDWTPPAKRAESLVIRGSSAKVSLNGVELKPFEAISVGYAPSPFTIETTYERIAPCTATHLSTTPTPCAHGYTWQCPTAVASHGLLYGVGSAAVQEVRKGDMVAAAPDGSIVKAAQESAPAAAPICMYKTKQCAGPILERFSGVTSGSGSRLICDWHILSLETYVASRTPFTPPAEPPKPLPMNYPPGQVSHYDGDMPDADEGWRR